VIAKRTGESGEGADAELQAVCTQGLNLFRVLALALAPVLPAMTRQASGFLAAPLQHWNDADAPLLDHAINDYQPLFTRIDPKQIEAMTEASKDTMTATPAGTAEAAKQTATISIDDFAKLRSEEHTS